MQLSDADFAGKAPAIATRIASGNLGGRAVNALVAAAFKDATITSRADVVKLYENLFASLAPKMKAYVAAQAKGQPLTEWDPP